MPPPPQPVSHASAPVEIQASVGELSERVAARVMAKIGGEVNEIALRVAETVAARVAERFAATVADRLAESASAQVTAKLRELQLQPTV